MTKQTIDRDENGRYKKGASGNPNGRPKKEREVRFMEITLAACSFEDWKKIVKKAVEQSLDGEHQARKWLSGYLLGLPLQRLDVAGVKGRPFERITIETVKDYGENNDD